MRRFVFWILIVVSATAADREISFRRQSDRIDVLSGGDLFTSFHTSDRWDKPFLYPLRTSGGIAISRRFPVEQDDSGGSTDHTWQRGIWWAHGDINGTDFWRELGREKTGRSVLIGAPEFGSNTLTAEIDLLTPQGKSLGTVRQTFTFTDDGSRRFIDVDVVVMASRGESLSLGDTEECCLGLRFRDEFRQDRGATLINSDGLKDTENIWGKRAKWIDYTTTVDSRKVGAAMFDHPANPRYPTWWHARGYAFASANPTGERNFTGDQSKDGTLKIPAGGKLEFRYRVVIHNGTAGDARIAGLYESWAGSKR